MGRKAIIIVKVLTFLLPLLVSCKQSCFDTLTHNDVGYWSDGWSPKDPFGSIKEFSRNDSTLRYLDETWAYDDWPPALWGLKFKITNDTLFTYVNRNGSIKIYDTLSIVSYSNNTINSKTNDSYYVKWHRISTRYARRMMSSRVKLSSLLKTQNHDKKIRDIIGVVWKLYGYGDVSTGIVKKSKSLKNSWMNVIKFWGNGTMSGLSTHSKLCGAYTISGLNIEIVDINNDIGREDYDGKEFCTVLPQCNKFRIKNNWLLLFYNDGKNYLIFKVADNFK